MMHGRNINKGSEKCNEKQNNNSKIKTWNKNKLEKSAVKAIIQEITFNGIRQTTGYE